MDRNKITLAIFGATSLITGLAVFRSYVKSTAVKYLAYQLLGANANAKNIAHSDTPSGVKAKKSISFSEAWGILPGAEKVNCSVIAAVTTLGLGCLADLASLRHDKTNGIAGVLFGTITGLTIGSTMHRNIIPIERPLDMIP